LVELVVVAAFLVMMLAVAMPLFSQTIAQRRLTSAVERVINDLRHVQSLAVTDGNLHRLRSGADLGVGRPGEYRLERSTDNGATWVPLRAWYDPSADYRGSKLQTINDNLGTAIATHDVRFNSQGAVANTVGNWPIVLTIVAESGATGRVQVMRTGVVRVAP
jgi:Tfp pilus assembly protein FimT